MPSPPSFGLEQTAIDPFKLNLPKGTEWWLTKTLHVSSQRLSSLTESAASIAVIGFSSSTIQRSITMSGRRKYSRWVPLQLRLLSRLLATIVMLHGMFTLIRFSAHPLDNLEGALTRDQLVLGGKIIEIPTSSSSSFSTWSAPLQAALTNDTSRFSPTFRNICNDPPFKILKHLQVASLPINEKQPKILCFLMTSSQLHSLRVAGIRQTWGKRCDKWVVASNQNDTTLDAIEMKSRASYQNLWNKLNETLHYIWRHYRDEYDWFFKVDDDTYVIMENLKAYLMSDEISSKKDSQPLILGRRYAWVKAGDMKSRQAPFLYFFKGSKWVTRMNGDFRHKFYMKFDNETTIVYNHGGAGYVMNRLYVERFLQALDGPDTLRGIPDEDLAHGTVMAYHGVVPESTRDRQGRERFHPESPDFMYEKSIERIGQLVGILPPNEPARNGTECCSAFSISFHHMNFSQLQVMEDYLYSCSLNGTS